MTDMKAKDMTWPFDADKWAKFITRCQINFDLGCHEVTCREDMEYLYSQALAADAELKRLRDLLNMDYRDLVDQSFDIGGWNKLTAEEQWAVRNTFIELRRRAGKEG